MALFNLFVVTCFALYLVRLLRPLLRKTLVDKLTAVNDLVLLGRARPTNQKLPGTAVIAGGSIAGLLAARVCSDHYESVLVVEPETGLSNHNYAQFTAEANSNSELVKRPRVFQYNAAHGYQVLTLRALKKLFPHFEDSLRAWGGRILPADMRVHISGRLIAPPTELTDANETVFASRHLYESLLRALVTRTCPNIRFTHGSVIGVPPSSTSTHDGYLSSVMIRADDKELVHGASLLVDCTGVAQAGLKWLEKAGYGKFSHLRVSYDPQFRGTTCHFRVPDSTDEELGALYLYIPEPLRDVRNFYIQRVERDWLQIVCAGYGIADRLTSFEDISAFFSRTRPSVPIPQHIHALPAKLSESGALAKGWQYFRLSDVSFVRYDTATVGSLPANFVALGDAVCRMNPIHGQGATLAVVGALTLNAALTGKQRALPHDFASSFFARLAARTVGTWEANKCNDYGYSSTERTPGDGARYGTFHRWYGAHLVEIASHDSGVAATMWHIQNFLAPGTDVISLSIICKVLWNCVKQAASALRIR